MKKININFTKFKKIIKAIPKVLANNALLVFICLILFDLILGTLIFYQYNVLPQKKEVEVEDKPLVLKEKELAEVLNYIQQREQRFQQAVSKNYPDLFTSSLLTD